MEQSLIDKDKLVESMVWRDDQGMILSIDDVLDIIDTVPTIDPETLRPHGRWERMLDPYGKLEGFIHVECGFYGPCAYNYCPRCGAKMEE